MCQTQARTEVLLSPQRTTQPLRAAASEIQACVTILWWPQVSFTAQLQLPAEIRNIAVCQTGAMTIDVRVLQTSAITLEFEAVSQLVLWCKSIRVHTVHAIVEEIGINALAEGVAYTGYVRLRDGGAQAVALE